MRWYVFTFLIFSLLLTSCQSLTQYSQSSSKETNEIYKHVERIGDSEYYAASEAELYFDSHISNWDFIDLVDLEYNENQSVHDIIDSSSNQIIKFAKTYRGTPYRFGGTTNKGMDCSGLVYTSFKSQNIYLPRVSRDMAREGQQINIQQTKPGDLLFFKTNRSRNSINHVGIVVDVNGDDIQFIHSSTTKGVIISSIKESYWQRAFTEARRIL